MPGVYIEDGDHSFDIALRKFKKQVEKAEKPSVQRKKKKAAARKRLLKKIRKLGS